MLFASVRFTYRGIFYIASKTTVKLYHYSEDSTIPVFYPRSHPQLAQNAVWAIEENYRYHYILPRDCPRICFRASSMSKDADIDRYLLGDPNARVMAIEKSWMPRVLRTELTEYHLPSENFILQDKGAGYYISYEKVIPHTVRKIPNILDELMQFPLELRLLDRLWPLHDAIAASSLNFSMIRMRNAEN